MAIRIVTKFEDVKIPRRSTEYSAGYDVFSNKNIEILSGQEARITLPAGIDFNPDENRAFIFLRSSIGMKKNLRLVNDDAIVPFLELESDTPGKHQVITLRNVGEENFTIEEGMHFLQFVIVDTEESYLPFVPEQVGDLQGAIPTALSIKEVRNGVQLVLGEPIFIEKGKRVMLASGWKFKIALDSFLGGFVPEGEKRFAYSNGTPIIDSDYILAENEGHCFFSFDNVTEEDITLEIGTPLVELVSIPYYKAENEIAPTEKRTGGIGSTTKPKEDR
ncbi:dCTP deaminase/dUTPase family protein [Bacillus cereus]